MSAAGRLGHPHQDADDVFEVLLAEAVGQAHHFALPGPGQAECWAGTRIVCRKGGRFSTAGLIVLRWGRYTT
jgi:hypothetical protein